MKQKIRVKKLQNSPYVIAPDQAVGKGSFSTILRAYNMQNPKQELVSKIISVKDAQTSVTIKAQLQILKKLPYHPNLVNCMKFQISSQNNFYLIMEYCNEGNLDKYMYKKKNQITEQKIWFFLKQFCEGYKVLYNNGIVHRDIKPENILIHNGDFKIADFGLSKTVENTEIVSNMSSKGTPLYMAPEIHQQKQGNSKIDVFSLGVVLYRVAFGGEYPFFDQGRKYRSIEQYFKQLLIRKLVLPANHNRSPALVQLVERMLIKDKQKRISWKQVFQVPQIKSAIRYQRKKQLAPMEQLQRSITVVNKSQTQVKIFQAKNPVSSTEQSADDSSSTNIILEETFNKRDKNNFEKKLFHHKLLYTLIEYTNKKMNLAIKKILIPLQLKSKFNKVYKHIEKNLGKIIEIGVLFSLHVISRLQLVSGDWSALNQGEIMNFEEIFENDKLIFLDQYAQLQNNKSSLIQQKSKPQAEQSKIQLSQTSGLATQQNSKKQGYVIGTYQDSLYNILSEYFEYPTQIRTELRPIFGLLLDIYDLAVKSDFKDIQQTEKNNVELIEEQTSMEFYQYLLNIQTVKQHELKEQMIKKGLIFL